jgi:pimeloyl-ACP methyl ester carboxylesterase
VKEQALSFGKTGSLVGVLSEPDAPSRLPHLLIFNAGFVHHVGPGRLSVEIARQVAQAGFATLRFDFSGIGDSAPRVPALDAISCGIADAREAMDHLTEAHGAERFVLLGLCSGARHAHHVAKSDPRVVGAVMLDGYAFPTPKSMAMGIITEVRDRLEDPLALIASAKRRALRMLSGGGKPASAAQEQDGDAFFPTDPTRAEMARDLQAFAARNLRLLCLYSGEWQTYRYDGQLQEAFAEVPLGAVLTERLIGTADHLYFTRPERTLLLATVTSWLRERFA